MKYGVPAVCRKCPPKHYYGLLIGPAVQSEYVRVRKTDVCDNCKSPLARMPAKTETPVL